VIDSLYAVVGGAAGRIFRTTDGGTSWISSPSGVSDDLAAIAFSDRLHGTVIGGTKATILRSDDGGQSWHKQTNGEFSEFEAFSSVSFSDSLNGAIVPWNFGRIYHTSDGGKNWIAATPPLARGLRRVRLRGSYGLAVGYIGDTYRTTDAGVRWFFHSSNTGSQTLRDVHLADSLHAIAVGDGGVIRRTTDGGVFWTIVTSGTTLDLERISFDDDLNGIIGAVDGSVLRTTDGGLTWSAPEATPMKTVGDFSFAPPGAGPGLGMVVTGIDGRIFRTTDGGLSWVSLEYSFHSGFTSVFTVSSESLYCVGEGGRIVFSSDHGRTLQPRDAPVTSTLRRVGFPDRANGWIVGDAGVVLTSTDGGATWSRRTANTAADLHSLSTPGPGDVIVGGDNNTILRTSDGGTTWTARPGPVADDWIALSFLTPDDGVAAGRNGSIIRTTNGGEQWDVVHTAGPLSDIQYVDPAHIYAAGIPAGDSLPSLLVSTDGGGSWVPRGIPAVGIGGMAFANRGFGILAGTGGLITTQDSGKNWVATRPSMATLRAVSFSGPRAAFAVGDSGVVARMRNNGDITGLVFHDLNSDTLRNLSEPGLAGRVIFLEGPFGDTAVTGQDGIYHFDSLPHAAYRVRIENRLFWEQTTPPLFTSDTLRVRNLSEHITGRNVGFMGPIVRLRIPIFVSDNSPQAHRFIWGGIRPGASYGISGADPHATTVDYIEGEVELPPRSFVRLSGVFDARFNDPNLPLEEYSEEFGQGSWTDTRPYTFPSQTDTFFLSFLPGIRNGGNYPMTLRWRADLLSLWFAGPVTLVDPFGAVTDMKKTGTLIVTDNRIESLLMVTNSPNIPDAFLTKWRLVSIPAPDTGAIVGSLFPSAVSGAYSYTPGDGYRERDTLLTGTGYWVKYPPAIDTLDFDTSALLSDTVAVSAGWNLIGSLSVPFPSGMIRTLPDSLIPGIVYGFGEGYEAADTLNPGAGYWVYANGAGSLILDAGSPKGTNGPRAPAVAARDHAGLESVHIRDADGRAGTLYFSPDEPGDVRSLLPPLPPAGVFDVRFGSDRNVGHAAAGRSSASRAVISSPNFPLEISVNGNTAIAVSIMIGNELFRIPPGSKIVIPSGDLLGTNGTGGRYILTLVTSEAPGLPAEYSLLQNYPNPFNPSTTIRYAVPAASHVRIRIFDVVGREVAAPFDGMAEAGDGTVIWDSRTVSSGVYFYRMDAVSVSDPSRTFTGVKKMIVIR